MALVRRRIVVRGRVQGVFFRDSAQREAGQRDLTGWVRNRDDGAVEAVVQGDTEAVAAFVSWARQGPSSADVDSADVADEPVTEGESGFEVR